MSGNSIEVDDFTIVVDKWDGSFLRRPGCKPHYFFLSHLHADHIKGLSSTWSRIIYTSPFNAWLLPMRRNVKPVLLKEIELNVTHTIRKSNNEVAFDVTLLDANHCPGAVMFLFQGIFGNILYTGDFRYTPRMLEYPVLSPIIRNKELTALYLDNTYASTTCKFPSREKALTEVLKIIDENPDCKIFIGMRQLGKEEVLRAVALHVNEKVCVSTQRLQILSKLEYEDLFTTDTSKSRIHAVELHNITQRHSQEQSKVISIKLTSMYECGNLDRNRGNIYIVPYSDHSSHTELMEFVDHLRPSSLHPIVQPKIPKMTGDMGPYYRMSTINCVIPEEILKLCGRSSAGTPDVAPAPDANQMVINGSLFSIKFHPAPKTVNLDKKATSIYIDEGMNLVPFDALSSHLTNNNKARKHIKASWTRLAPKILAPKGIKFSEPSPEKQPGQDEDALLKENSDTLYEVPLSDDDDELDMPSSAKELGLRLQRSASMLPVNGTHAVDEKSESSTDIIEDTPVQIRKTRSREKFEIPPRRITRNTCNDTESVISDISSSVRTTRSKSSVSSLPVIVVGKPAGRRSLESQQGDAAQRSPSKRSPKEVLNTKGVSTRSSSSPNTEFNGISKKSVSLENLSIKLSPKVSMKKSSKSSKEDIACEKRDLQSVKLLKGMKSLLNTDNIVPENSSEAQGNNCVVKADANDVFDSGSIKTDSEVKSETRVNVSVDTSNVLKPSDVTGEPTKKAPLNGNTLTSKYNGFHINSPGRKRVPLSCDWNAAQELAKKETEQALKALESLSQMRGFKTRNLGNRTGLAALRRLSADSIPMKSPVKGQNLVVLPVTPTGLRSRTASILSSMADNFSKQTPTKQTMSTNALSKSSKLKEAEMLECPSTSRQTQHSSSSTADQTASSSSVIKPTPASGSATVTKATSSTSIAEQPEFPNSSEGFKSSAHSSLTKDVVPGSPSVPSATKRPETRSSTSASPTESPAKELSPIPPVKDGKKISPRRVKQQAVIVESKDRCDSSPTKEKQALNVRNKVLQTEMGDSKKTVDQSRNHEEKITRKSASIEEESTLPSVEPANTSEESAPVEMVESGPSSGQHVTTEDSLKSEDTHNQGLFLTDETLASSSSSRKTLPGAVRRSYYKKQNDVNVDLIRLKVGFAMTQKDSKRLSLPSRLPLAKCKSPPLHNRQKVHDWKSRISLRLRKSPQRQYRFKSPNKLRENAKRTLASILRSGRTFSSSQGYHGDVEDCTELSQPTSQESMEENSGYSADIESSAPHDIELSGKSNESALFIPQQANTVSQDSCLSGRSEHAVSMEPRRSSRLLKEDAINLPRQNVPSKSVLISKALQERGNKSSTNVAGISPIQESSHPCGSSSATELSPARFSDRLSERSKMIFRKSAESVLTQETNILSLMADAFNQKTIHAPTTANILSSMAENFKKLDEGAQVSPSLSIQLVSSKPKSTLLKGENPSDWGVQITRIDSSSSKTQGIGRISTLEGLPISLIPKSLSIEIIPESGVEEPVQRKGPSPPTVTISPEVIDLSSDYPEDIASQSTIHSVPLSPGPKRVLQGTSRWPSILKSEVQSPPQAVWKEKRRCSQSGDKVIIDIETQDDPQKVPHCPVHCTCGVASKQGTCMGTMKNLIDADADCLYEVPLSPEDFEDSGGMLALGKNWIEACFENPHDREEFMTSYEDLLPTLASCLKERKSKPRTSNVGTSSGQARRPSQSHFRPVLNSSSTTKECPVAKQSKITMKKLTPAVSKKPAAEAPKKLTPTASAVVKKQIVVKQTAYVSKAAVEGLPVGTKQYVPKKRSSTDTESSKASSSTLSEKKNKSVPANQSNNLSVVKTAPPRRSSSQSTSSSSSVPKSRPSKRSASPDPLPPPPVPPKRKIQGSEGKSEAKKGSENVKRKNVNSSTCSSDSPEVKKARQGELERLIDMDKSSDTKRYKLSVKRSLDHLMTRQKLRSDRRVKASNSSRQ